MFFFAFQHKFRVPLSGQLFPPYIGCDWCGLQQGSTVLVTGIVMLTASFLRRNMDHHRCRGHLRYRSWDEFLLGDLVPPPSYLQHCALHFATWSFQLFALNFTLLFSNDFDSVSIRSLWIQSSLSGITQPCQKVPKLNIQMHFHSPEN